MTIDFFKRKPLKITFTKSDYKHTKKATTKDVLKIETFQNVSYKTVFPKYLILKKNISQKHFLKNTI